MTVVPIRQAEQTVQFLERRDTPSVEEAYELFEAGVAYVWRRCDILNFDFSPWKNNVGIVSGTITVDNSRPERRSGDIILDNLDGELDPDPENGFWYDKLLRIWRGVVVDRELNDDPMFDGTAHCWPLGTFMIDRLNQKSAETTISVSFRDLSKKMQNSKLAYATTFVEGTEAIEIVRAMVLNSGLLHVMAAPINQPLGRDFSFEQGTSRWDIATQVLEAYALEGFCDVDGGFVVRPFTDPVSSPASLLLVGHPDGVCAHGYRSNIGSFEKSSSDERMYNHVVVKGEATGAVIPVTAEAENNEPTSNTRIERIGRRTYTYSSKFIETEEQARTTARKFLGIHALEQFEVSTNGIVYPFLEAGTTIEFHDDHERMTEEEAPIGTDYAPIRFLLQNFSIPLGLGEMVVQASRVSIVNDVRDWSGTASGASGEPGLVGVSGKFTGIQKIFGQTGTLALTRGSSLFGARYGVSVTLTITARPGVVSLSQVRQIATTALTAVPGTRSVIATKIAQVRSIPITPQPGTWTLGPVSKTAQVATFTITPRTSVVNRSITPAGLTITAVPGLIYRTGILNEALVWIDADDATATSTYVKNRGTAGSILDATVMTGANAPTWLPSGRDGAYFYIPGTGSLLNVPPSTALDVGAQFEVTWEGTANWHEASTVFMAYKGTSSSYGAIDWGFMTNGGSGAGRPLWQWSDSGTGTLRSLGPGAVVPFVNGQHGHVKVTFVSNNGTQCVATFYTSFDGQNWTQLGVPGVSTPATFAAGTKDLYVGGRPAGGIGCYFNRLIVRSAIDGPVVLDINPVTDLVNENASTFVCATGQLVSIVRNANGPKAVAVARFGRARWLLGTDDYLQIPNHDLLNNALTTSFTAIAVRRKWGLAPSNSRFFSKREFSVMSMGWFELHADTTPSQKSVGSIGVGFSPSVQVSSTNVTPAEGQLISQALVRNMAQDLVINYHGGYAVGQLADTLPVGTILSNTAPLRIGYDGSAYCDAEIEAVMLFPRILQEHELLEIAEVYNAGPLSEAVFWISAEDES